MSHTKQEARPIALPPLAGSGVVLTPGERLACYRWHRDVAHRFREVAERNRTIAAKRGSGWQAHLRKALKSDGIVREHEDRAKIFLPNLPIKESHEV